MEDSDLTLPCDRHFRIKWWCQLVCKLMVQPWTVGQVDEAEQEHVAKTLPSLPYTHPSVSLQWLLQAPCYMVQEVLSITACIMEDEWLSSGTDQLRLLFKWCFLLPWRLVWKAEYCAKGGCLSTHLSWWGEVAEYCVTNACTQHFSLVPVPSSAGKVPYRYGTWDFVSP